MSHQYRQDASTDRILQLTTCRMLGTLSHNLLALISEYQPQSQICVKALKRIPPPRSVPGARLQPCIGYCGRFSCPFSPCPFSSFPRLTW